MTTKLLLSFLTTDLLLSIEKPPFLQIKGAYKIYFTGFGLI